jgi:predicted RNA-binding Zn ribbon-like protein
LIGVVRLEFTPQRYRGEGFGEYSCIDVVNSEQWDGFGRRTDHLEDPTWVAAFLGYWGITATPGVLDELRAGRAILRPVFERVASGERLGDEDLDAINAALAVPVRRALVRAEDGVRLDLVPYGPAAAWPLAQVAASAAELLVHGMRRLKVCPNPGCRWVFFDRTNGNSRRWCNDRTCGNRDKVRRFRDRQVPNQPDR